MELCHLSKELKALRAENEALVGEKQAQADKLREVELELSRYRSKEAKAEADKEREKEKQRRLDGIKMAEAKQPQMLLTNALLGSSCALVMMVR